SLNRPAHVLAKDSGRHHAQPIASRAYKLAFDTRSFNPSARRRCTDDEHTLIDGQRRGQRHVQCHQVLGLNRSARLAGTRRILRHYCHRDQYSRNCHPFWSSYNYISHSHLILPFCVSKAALDHSNGNVGPNIGRPLTDVSRVASSSMTSQCSAKRPFSRRTISTTIQFAGKPRPVMRPCSISRFSSAKIAPFSYRIVSGTDLINPNRPSRPGGMCLLC